MRIFFRTRLLQTRYSSTPFCRKNPIRTYAKRPPLAEEAACKVSQPGLYFMRAATTSQSIKSHSAATWSALRF